MAIFKWNNLIGQLNPLLQWMLNESWRRLSCWVQLANMCQHCSLSAVQRKTAFVEESWWPEFNLSGSMPWCSFPWHKHLPRLAQKNCYTVYSLNQGHQFHPDSQEKQEWILELSFGNAGPSSQASLYKSMPRSAFESTIFKWKNLIGQLNHTEPIARMNVEWKLEKAEFAEFNMPTCGNIAVWLCRERQPLWKSHDGLNWTCLDQCHCVRFHGTSSSSQADAKELSYSLQSKFDPWVYIYILVSTKWFVQVCQGKPSHGNRKR